MQNRSCSTPNRRPLSKPILPRFFVSLELSRSIWLITSLSPGLWREDVEAFCASRGRCGVAGAVFGVEAEGVCTETRKILSRSWSSRKRVLDGFRTSSRAGAGKESKATSSIRPRLRRQRAWRRRAKTDRIDGEALLRALLAYKRACANRGCVRWSGRRRPRKKPRAAASAANARC